MRRSIVLLAVVLIALLGALAATPLLDQAPPLRAWNSSSQFDAVRAKARLAAILGDQRPHPADSTVDDAVRERLVAQLNRMGLRPIVRDQIACNDFQKARLVACAHVHNVIAHLGPQTGTGLALSAHYDSVPVGPGAGDDGVGVATLLEVGSILKDRQLRRPVMLLFNEGEELGLVGARAFLADPVSRQVDSILNFDARGVTGPVTMFETSRPNGAAIAAFARAVGRPMASSMATDVARLIPNDTDATVYKERDWLILNFAMTGNETRYHSPGDDLAALDARSLQHMGDQALAVATELSDDLPQPHGNRIFSDVLGRGLIQMPLALGITLFVILLASFAAIAWRSDALVRGPAVIIAALLLGSAASWVALSLMGLLRAGAYWRAHPEFSFVAIYVTAVATALAVLCSIGARIAAEKLRIAFWLTFLVLGGTLSLVAPGAIIYFLFPPAAVLLGMAAARGYRPAVTIGGLAAVLLLYLTWGEMLGELQELFSPGPLWVVAPVGSVIGLAALVEAWPIIHRVREAHAIGIAAILALCSWTAVAAAPAYSQDHQQRFTIEQVTQLPSGKNFWSVLNDGAALPAAYSAWGPWVRRKLPFSERLRWLAEAPSDAAIKPPSVRLLENVRNGGERTIRLRLQANGAERILLVGPETAKVTSAGAPGSIRSISSTEATGKVTISCTGRSCDGMEFLVTMMNPKPVLFTIVGARDGLPPSAVPLLRARPADARPQYVPDETVALIHVNL